MPLPSDRHRGTTDVRVESAVTIDRPADEIYRFWRRLENLPRFMQGIDAVQVFDDRRSLWSSTTSDGRPVKWETEILDDRENEALSWASARGADVVTWGSVRFLPAPGGRGTEVHLALHFVPPPSERVAEWFWNLFGKGPEEQMRDDLRRLKQWMELGELVESDASRRRDRSPDR